MNAVADKPLFRSIEQAMSWAYYFACHDAGTIAPSGIVRMMKKDEREREEYDRWGRLIPKVAQSKIYDLGPRPAGYDAAAQAGMICAFIQAMPETEVCHLWARFLRHEHRTAAKRRLRELVLPAMSTGVIPHRLIAELVSRYYGKPGIRMAELARTYKIDRRRVTSLARDLEAALNAVAFRAERSAYDGLQKMGVVS